MSGPKTTLQITAVSACNQGFLDHLIVEDMNYFAMYGPWSRAVFGRNAELILSNNGSAACQLVRFPRDGF